MSNAYLVSLRTKFEEARTGIETIQTRAVDEKRDLTEDELRSITEHGDAAKALAEQIKPLVEIENRNAEISSMTANLFPATEVATADKPEVRSASTSAVDRDPGHYRSEHDGGQHSFFADNYRAQVLQDEGAKTRLAEHSRAVVQSPAGTGLVPPKWLADEYMAIGRQARAVANRVRNIPLGRDPRPLLLPKQTVGTDANILTQSAEGANTAGWGTDRYASDKDTLTPVTKAAYQDVSRQLLDSSSPAVDAIVFGDLRAAWDSVVETLVCTAILAGGTAAGTTWATQTAWKASTATPAFPIDAIIDAQTAVAGDLRGPADLAIMNFKRFGEHRKLKDTALRPLMPVTRYNPQNSTGALDNLLVGDIEGVDVIASNGVPTATLETYAVLRSQAVFLAESDLLSFTYEQVVGPSSVRMGIWGYVGALVRNPASVSIQTITSSTT